MCLRIICTLTPRNESQLFYTSSLDDETTLVPLKTTT
jgi:hypothetical protein